MKRWQEFVKNQMRQRGHGILSPQLVCIDLKPRANTQALVWSDVLNVGGFCEVVFSVIAALLADYCDWFVSEVEMVEL